MEASTLKAESKCIQANAIDNRCLTMTMFSNNLRDIRHILINEACLMYINDI